MTAEANPIIIISGLNVCGQEPVSYARPLNLRWSVPVLVSRAHQMWRMESRLARIGRALDGDGTKACWGLDESVYR